VRRTRLRRHHVAPASRCECGIYATARGSVTEHLARASWWRSAGLVVGEVALWGTVVEAEWGWRSGRAYPHRLFFLPPPDTDAAHASRILSALERYGVPVTALDARTGRAAARAVAAIAPSA
jgi:hypothetical protein